MVAPTSSLIAHIDPHRVSGILFQPPTPPSCTLGVSRARCGGVQRPKAGPPRALSGPNVRLVIPDIHCTGSGSGGSGSVRGNAYAPKRLGVWALKKATGVGAPGGLCISVMGTNRSLEGIDNGEFSKSGCVYTIL